MWGKLTETINKVSTVALETASNAMNPTAQTSQTNIAVH